MNKTYAVLGILAVLVIGVFIGGKVISPSIDTSKQAADVLSGTIPTNLPTDDGQLYKQCSITSFTATPASIASGGTSTLSWSTKGCRTATLDGVAVATPSGSKVTSSLTATKTFTLVAQGSGSLLNTQTKTVKVVVTPPTSPFTITVPNGNEVYRGGQYVDVKWTSTGLPASYKVLLRLKMRDVAGGSGVNNTGIMLNGNLTFPAAPLLDGHITVQIPTIAEIQSYGGSFANAAVARNYKIEGSIWTGSGYITDISDDFFTIDNSVLTGCTIDSLIVPASTTRASNLSTAVSWTMHNCSSVRVIASSGSYERRQDAFPMPTGAYTFVAPASLLFSTADNSMEVTLIAGDGVGSVSMTKSVSITDAPAPAANQCAFTTLKAVPAQVSSASPQATISWATQPGCNVYVVSLVSVPGGFLTTSIFKPVTSYFNATDSVVVTPSTSTTYYITAQAGASSATTNTNVISAKTLDIKKY